MFRDFIEAVKTMVIGIFIISIIIFFVGFVMEDDRFIEVEDGKACHITKPSLSTIFTEKCYKLEEIK